jgi:endonuclease YncB( thermonuclease family)
MSVVARLKDLVAVKAGSLFTRKLALALIFGCIFVAVRSTAVADSLTGQVSIIDGDTVEMHGTRIRLWGIDAPEANQLCRGEDSLQYRCGAKAANDLHAFVASRVVACMPIKLDRYRRTVASCSVDGADIGHWLVLNGLAIDWPTYSLGKYADAQADAEVHQRGIWSGSFAKPWAFRACLRSGGRVAECSDE